MYTNISFALRNIVVRWVPRLGGCEVCVYSHSLEMFHLIYGVHVNANGICMNLAFSVDHRQQDVVYY